MPQEDKSVISDGSETKVSDGVAQTTVPLTPQQITAIFSPDYIHGSLADTIDKKAKASIEKLYSNITPDDEFELMFFNYRTAENMMGFEHFLKVLEYLTYRSKSSKLKLEKTNTLDISHSPATKKTDKVIETYRVSLNDIDTINKHMEMLHTRNNHVIFSVLTEMHKKDNSKNITLLKKVKDFGRIVDIHDYDMRLRVSKELSLTASEISSLKELDQKAKDAVTFRYKQRVSLIVEDNQDITIRIDLTNIKMGKNIDGLESTNPFYELEIDMTAKKSGISNKYLNTMYSEATTLQKIIQQSNYIISSTLKNRVLLNYRNLMGITDKEISSISVRKPQSLELQHAVDQLPNKYAVTDKADGERYLLIIVNKAVFLISDTLHIKNTGIILATDKFNDSILDGEYVFLPTRNRHLFMAFDCLSLGSKDMRDTQSFLDRLRAADTIIDSCFILPGQIGYKMTEFTGAFAIDKVMDFHKSSIDSFMTSLNHDIDKEKGFPLIRRKYFIPVYGGKNNEIFRYSSLLWNKYVYDKKTNCPYILDGLMYHPLEQKYVISAKESKLLEYKWKPPEKNSIDFYIQFERSRETGKILTVYDNSREEYIRGKSYKIINLYVGKQTRNEERPTLFQEEEQRYICHLFLDDGDVRDQEGHILQDRTVVEFYYNNDPSIPSEFRWVPMRTRHDKTEMVQRFGKRYGNYIDIANKVWRSIKNPFLMEDITTLSNDDMYAKHIEFLRGKVDHTVIVSEMKENIYYQKKTALAKPMRNFHNWMKSILIYTFCNPTYENERSLSVLDIGCGRGGDIMKFYYAKTSLYVGIDINMNNLTLAVDGAISRYNQLRRTHPNFPSMFFINADGGGILDYSEQVKILGSMSDKNKIAMNRFFSKDKPKRTLFDRINCQFALHYLLINDTTWNNFLQNVNMYLKPGGYLLITCFDSDRVRDVLKDKSQYTITYTDKDGHKDVLVDIVKKYEETDSNADKPFGTGYAIDVYNSLISYEDVYFTEYLVDKNFITQELLNKCGAELVETDLFDNQFIINEPYFKRFASYEENEKTNQFLMNAGEYYDQSNEINKACYKFTRLNRLYVFRKKDEFDNDFIKGSTKSQQQQPQEEKEKKRSSSRSRTNKKKQRGGGSNDNTDSETGSTYTDDGVTSSEGVTSSSEDHLPHQNQVLSETDDTYEVVTELEPYLNPTKFVRKDVSPGNYTFMTSIYNVLVNDEIIPKSVGVVNFYNDLGFKMIKDSELTDSNISSLLKNITVGHDYTFTEDKVSVAFDGANLLVLEKECNGDVHITGHSKKEKISRKDPTIILQRDGNIFKPIFRKNEDGRSGLFDTRMKYILRLIEECGRPMYPLKKGVE